METLERTSCTQPGEAADFYPNPHPRLRQEAAVVEAKCRRWIWLYQPILGEPCSGILSPLKVPFVVCKCVNMNISPLCTYINIYLLRTVCGCAWVFYTITKIRWSIFFSGHISFSDSKILTRIEFPLLTPLLTVSPVI